MTADSSTLKNYLFVSLQTDLFSDADSNAGTGRNIDAVLPQTMQTHIFPFGEDQIRRSVVAFVAWNIDGLSILAANRLRATP